MNGRSYKKGEKVLVDPGVFIASPTLREPDTPCIVLADASENDMQVYVSRESNHDTLYVFKGRIKP